MDFSTKLELEHKKLYEEFAASFPQYAPRSGYFAELFAFIERELEWREAFLDYVLDGAPSSTAYTEAAVCETVLLREIFAKAQRIIAEHKMSSAKKKAAYIEKQAACKNSLSEEQAHIEALRKTVGCAPWWLEEG